ncbi:3'(2'),5'-bisphosphate nucleotidase CysQ [Prosthecomicrobium pneumaticum]|uniref:Myo-inositol-1(Or 4)-monophosphatase n=1 Tax=Prosthecomicrobium pneumaticum TaxID=81895 RepID=A0A7W9FJZ3_9HYPH|nr:3'(2'),5'-bisphosphate nucleotidase CysQ [Prosthecomicrobium pneumaticum]MBB5752111.1 myo-inositol-1(or 4)-monophosphatase [Prosthecomicrobium pneumaticum]
MAAADDLLLIAAAAREAGAIALRYFRNNPRRWTKGVSSPVTEADIAVDDFLSARLRAARPDYGWLSEETADGPERLDRARVFVVDPIDGTRGFIEGDRRWTVSIAVVEHGRPVAAALYAPALDELFEARTGGGATLGGRPLALATPPALDAAHIAGPRRQAKLLGTRAPDFVPSLAYRIALVATGRIDVAIAGPNAQDWDIAAADLIVAEAGGLLADLDGAPPRYNRSDPRHPALVAAAPALQHAVAAALGRGHGA